MSRSSSSIVVGLEVGTSKICAVVADLSDSGRLNLIGVGQAKSRGVRKAEIIDAALATDDIRNAIADAEQMADAEVRSVFLGVSGGHIHSFNNRGYHPVASSDREISEEDVQDAIKNAKAINLPADHNVVHVVRQHYTIDGQDGVLNPVGMLGARVEVDVHVIHGQFNRLQNPINTVKGLQLDVDGIVFNGLASALTSLDPTQKELGALVIDLGAGTTDYAVYAGGVIKLTGVLAVGGDHVTNDLAYGLKVDLGRAEQLKINHGSALVHPDCKGQTVQLSNDLGLMEKAVNLEHLRRIMSVRLEETFQLISREVESAGLFDHLRAGVVLCGGGAHIPEITDLAEKVFSARASIGSANSMSGLKSALNKPEFATAIGLARTGSFELRKRAGRGGLLARGLRSAFGQLFRKAH